MQSLLRFLLRRRLVRPLRVLNHFLKDPVATQRRVLRGLLYEAAQTEWGRRYGFAELARLPDPVAAYQERVPLHSYEHFRNDIARMRDGEPDVLWPGTVRLFATSAGTTTQGKYTPATDDLILASTLNAAAGLLCYLAETENLACLRGMSLSLTGFVADDPEHPGVRMGEISGHGIEHWYRRSRLRRAITRRRNLPDHIRSMRNWDQKLDAIVDDTVDRDVRILAMVPSWGLQLFDRLLERYNQRNRPAATTVRDIWPNLSLVMTGGVPLRSYREQLERRIGPPAVDFVELYGASEAPIAFQSSRDDPSLLLHLDNGVFFEFVPFKQLDDPDAERRTVADVEPGVEYVPVVTTCGGLWAYTIGDVIRFTSVFPHKILVTGRTTELLDTYGEFVCGEEVREAIRHACQRTGLAVREFHVAPRPAGDGQRHAHQWLIEFDTPPDETEAFAEGLDECLQRLNPAYACCRREKGFGTPEVVSLEKGSFHRWLTTARQQVSAQTKVPVMSDNRELADAVLRRGESRPLARM